MSEVTEEPPEDRSRAFVQSLERGLSVIKAFTGSPPGMTPSDVARVTGLTRAAARRFLLTLQELGYVRTDGRLFRLTPAVLDLGYAFLTSGSPWPTALEFMNELADRARETCAAAELDGYDAVVVASAERRLMSMAPSVGTRFSAHASSMGRVLLAYLTDEEIEKYLTEAPFPRYTKRTLSDPEALRTELGWIRRRGWAMVDSELEEGMLGASVPIHGLQDKVVASLNIVTHSGRMSSNELIRDLLPQLQETAEKISDVFKKAQATSSKPKSSARLYEAP
jgi:IclR family transcriptional regulator, pca regulon regulatory protein